MYNITFWKKIKKYIYIIWEIIELPKLHHLLYLDVSSRELRYNRSEIQKLAAESVTPKIRSFAYPLAQSRRYLLSFLIKISTEQILIIDAFQDSEVIIINQFKTIVTIVATGNSPTTVLICFYLCRYTIKTLTKNNHANGKHLSVSLVT